ncbi:MAG: hypothetical protein IJS32_04070 [Kiritimatiellae bacterium]|nr:hypothetical protein [Kiritimatiellia bacterium]
MVTWTNDENQVVTVTNTAWSMAGPNLSGFGNDWEWRGTAGVTNGVGVFTDAGAVPIPSSWASTPPRKRTTPTATD